MRKSTRHIKIKGQVQGVGFRPFVFRVAKSYGLTGWVRNDLEGVDIVVSGSENDLDIFYRTILDEAPSISHISGSSVQTLDYQAYDSFAIMQGAHDGNKKLHITPDFATCPACTSELRNSDRRQDYAFITCSSCGPRYSIMHNVPFEREYTAMDEFEMCHSCLEEYQESADRRFHAQTISCPACGIKLVLFDSNRKELSLDERLIIPFIIDAWKEGKIVAIKGIGGYLLTCSAHHPGAIKTLRSKKHRPDKPFALMYPGLESLDDFQLSKKERHALEGLSAPILLMDKLDNQISTGICDELADVGVMLPYAPLFRILLDRYDAPIVATSGNISNDPIVYQDDYALDNLTEIADYIMVHNRKIVVPQDDSIIKLSRQYGHKVILRRSRGMAPSYFNKHLELPPQRTLAMGADMKSTCAFSHEGSIYISQYLGDLENYNTQVNYNHVLDHLSNLLRFRPEIILTDAHPNYVSSSIGEKLADTLHLPVMKVQHHIAHFSALLGEHSMADSKERILGVIWDGTGWGDDSAIWGSEFFIYNDYNFSRRSHLTYFSHIAGDKMTKEPRISALAISRNSGKSSFSENKFSDIEWQTYNRLLKKESGIKTSSMGRLFDAVASILGICDIQTYEGQAAILLQVKAEEFIRQSDYNFNDTYWTDMWQEGISTTELIREVIVDIQDDIDVGRIAAKFHITLVDWIGHVAKSENIRKVGFSGGVFQNTLLIDLIITKLGGEFDLLFHKDLSPNDENISFGQLIYTSITGHRPKE